MKKVLYWTLFWGFTGLGFVQVYGKAQRGEALLAVAFAAFLWLYGFMAGDALRGWFDRKIAKQRAE